MHSAATTAEHEFRISEPALPWIDIMLPLPISDFLCTNNNYTSTCFFFPFTDYNDSPKLSNIQCKLVNAKM